MNLRRLKYPAMAALALALASHAQAQSNNVPGLTDYSAFSHFITERNIFDPNRYPRSSNHPAYHLPVSRSTPAFTLVGAMNYGKGMFAFFDGNNPDLRKVLFVSDTNSIAGYRATEITLAGVTLESADKTQTVRMKIGQMMRQEGDEWQLAGYGGLPASASASALPAEDNLRSNAAAPPASSAPANDILKRLMEQREKELK